jgi:hypothetical protein
LRFRCAASPGDDIPIVLDQLYKQSKLQTEKLNVVMTMVGKIYALMVLGDAASQHLNVTLKKHS